MVASQHRVPRVYPLPKKVLSHSTFRALLERRRHTLDGLIALLRTGTGMGSEVPVSEKCPGAENLMQVDGNECAELGPASEAGEPEWENNGLNERGLEVGNKDSQPTGTSEEDGKRETQEGNAKGDESGGLQEPAERDAPGMNGAPGEASEEDNQAGGHLDTAQEVLPSTDADGELGNIEIEEEPVRQGDGSAGGETSSSPGGGEPKVAGKAQLEEQLNKLESKKHKLVQQLKQVLVREDSRKIVRPALAPSPIPSPSSITVSSAYYLPNSSPLPSASSSHPSPLVTPNQTSAAPRKDDDALEEGELPEGGSPLRTVPSAKPLSESERVPGLGSAVEWDRGPDRSRLMHSTSWDQRKDRYFFGGERSTVSPKAGYGGRASNPYYQPLSLRRNFSLGPNLTGPNRFPLRSSGSGVGLNDVISPQESMLPALPGDALGGLSPGNGVSGLHSRPRGR